MTSPSMNGQLLCIFYSDESGASCDMISRIVSHWLLLVFQSWAANIFYVHLMDYKGVIPTEVLHKMMFTCICFLAYLFSIAFHIPKFLRKLAHLLHMKL